MLVTVDGTTGERLSRRRDPIPNEEGGYRVVWADGAMVVAAFDEVTRAWSLSRYDPDGVTALSEIPQSFSV